MMNKLGKISFEISGNNTNIPRCDVCGTKEGIAYITLENELHLKNIFSVCETCGDVLREILFDGKNTTKEVESKYN